MNSPIILSNTENTNSMFKKKLLKILPKDVHILNLIHALALANYSGSTLILNFAIIKPLYFDFRLFYPGFVVTKTITVG